jgi:hypothetical protein
MKHERSMYLNSFGQCRFVEHFLVTLSPAAQAYSDTVHVTTDSRRRGMCSKRQTRYEGVERGLPRCASSHSIYRCMISSSKARSQITGREVPPGVYHYVYVGAAWRSTLVQPFNISVVGFCKDQLVMVDYAIE